MSEKFRDTGGRTTGGRTTGGRTTRGRTTGRTTGTTLLKTIELDDTQRSRLLWLVIAGVCLIGAVWVSTNTFRGRDIGEEVGAVLKKAKDSLPVERKPAEPAQSVQTATAGSAGSEAPDDSSAVAQVAEPARPIQPARTPGPDEPLEATPRLVAAAEAQADSGRADPFLPVTSYKKFPRIDVPAERVVGGGAADFHPDNVDITKLVPPPPPPGAEGLAPDLVAPPDAGLLAVDELPLPPARPSLANKLKLIGIVGDCAIFAFADPAAAKREKLPDIIRLRPGQQYESMSVVDVQAHRVTLDEDGERTVKEIPPIRG